MTTCIRYEFTITHLKFLCAATTVLISVCRQLLNTIKLLELCGRGAKFALTIFGLAFSVAGAALAAVCLTVCCLHYNNNSNKS